MSEYIGNRIVPHHDGVWDKAKEYEPLTIVYTKKELGIRSYRKMRQWYWSMKPEE